MPVHILDEIELTAAQIPTVLQWLEQRYLPGLPQRQALTLLNRWVSPPVDVPGHNNTLWLLWQVPDAMIYYLMRGTAGPEVAEFWHSVDAICKHRRRHILNDATQPLPQPLASTRGEKNHAA
jgi:hypothetical protein